MVHIVPSISFIKQFKSQIKSGISVSGSLKRTFTLEKSAFSHQVQLWWSGYRNGNPKSFPFNSHYERAFIDSLKQGLEGAPILKSLENIENEMLQEFEIQWKAYLESLPIKLSIPLLFLFFPSYVILIFGPLIVTFLQGVN